MIEFSYSDILLLYTLSFTFLFVGSVVCLSLHTALARKYEVVKRAELFTLHARPVPTRAPALFLLHGAGITLFAVIPGILFGSALTSLLLGFLYGMFVFGHHAFFLFVTDKKISLISTLLLIVLHAAFFSALSGFVYLSHLILL